MSVPRQHQPGGEAAPPPPSTITLVIGDLLGSSPILPDLDARGGTFLPPDRAIRRRSADAPPGPDAASPRPEPEPPPGHLLAGLSNQALARLLARAPKPDPQRTKSTRSETLRDIDAAEWERRLNKGESMIPLYADIATQIGNAGLRDVRARTSSTSPGR